MQSGQVNASQLLASFLGSENEKIGQSIMQCDFAGELKKLMPEPANQAKRGTGASSRNAQAKLDELKAADSGQPDSSTKTSDPSSPERSQASSAASTLPGAAEAKSGLQSSIGAHNGTAGSKTKIKAINSKVQKAKNLVVTDPAIAETVLADLRYPAETIKTCKNIQNKDGQISIEDLKTILDTQPASGSENGSQVPAEHARALVESIISRQGGANQKGSTSGASLKHSIQIKTEGSYSPDEFRGLLENVLQEADTVPAQFANQEQGLQAGSAQTVKTANGIKEGQTESLVSTILPSFIFADRENDPTGKVLAANSNNSRLEAQMAKAADVSESSIEAVSNNFNSDKRLSAAKIGSADVDGQGTAPGTQAVQDGASGISTVSASATSSSRQETASIPVQGLDPILKYFDARIVSAVEQQPGATSTQSPVPGGPHDGLAAQAQNLASQVKGAEKQADGGRGTSSSSRLSQEIGEQSEALPIKTASAEYPPSEWSLESTPNQTADPAQKSEARAIQAKFDPEELRAQLQEAVENGTAPDESLGKAGEDVGPLAQSMSGKVSGSNGGIVNGADLPAAALSANPVGKDGTPATLMAAAEMAVQFLETSQGQQTAGKAASGVMSEMTAEDGGKTTGQSELTWAMSGLDFSIENHHSKADPSASGEDPDQALQESEYATTGTDQLKMAASNATLGGQETVVLAKQLDKQLGHEDPATGSAVFQNAVSSSLQAARSICPRRTIRRRTALPATIPTGRRNLSNRCASISGA